MPGARRTGLFIGERRDPALRRALPGDCAALMRLGYAPYDHTLSAPGDRKRFVAWAQARDVDFVIADEPRADIDVAVVAMAADLIRWRKAPPGMKVIYDITDD